MSKLRVGATVVRHGRHYTVQKSKTKDGVHKLKRIAKKCKAKPKPRKR